ncbi:MAG: hypothetical protein PHZ25_03590 [Candidatus Pacebacteria bacterium]|nr:hypothetical protein [Candidatus Paceibacterota bacterium]
MNKKLIFSIIITILAISAVFAYQKYGKPESVNPDNGNTPPVSNENEKYKGETILEADGWKKYTNSYWGIEFRFQDKEDEVVVEGGSNGITLSGEKDDYVYIYIGNIHSLDKITLKQYIEERRAWDYWQMNGELISIKEITNENNLTFTETSVDYGKSISKTYFIEYPKNGKDFLKIFIGTNQQLLKEVVNSFRFID